MPHDSAYERQAVDDYIRDVAFAGGIPDGARIRGAFWRGFGDVVGLFIETSDGRTWLYRRDGTRRPWTASGHTTR